MGSIVFLFNNVVSFGRRMCIQVIKLPLANRIFPLIYYLIFHKEYPTAVVEIVPVQCELDMIHIAGSVKVTGEMPYEFIRVA
jgi:hypothetical protein